RDALAHGRVPERDSELLAHAPVAAPPGRDPALEDAAAQLLPDVRALHGRGEREGEEGGRQFGVLLPGHRLVVAEEVDLARAAVAPGGHEPRDQVLHVDARDPELLVVDAP